MISDENSKLIVYLGGTTGAQLYSQNYQKLVPKYTNQQETIRHCQIARAELKISTITSTVDPLSIYKDYTLVLVIEEASDTCAMGVSGLTTNIVGTLELTTISNSYIGSNYHSMLVYNLAFRPQFCLPKGKNDINWRLAYLANDGKLYQIADTNMNLCFQFILFYDIPVDEE